MSRRLFFTRNRPANVDNHYVVGSGVGSKSRFVRSALRRRSSNNAQGKPCCHSIPKKKDDVLSKLEEEKNCTGGMVWKECGSACTRTCSDPEPLCTKQCVPKCECPDGQVLEGGQCTQKYNCPYQNQCDHGFSPYKIKDTSMCCWTDDIGPDGSGCSNLNSVCYLGASGGLLQVCPKSNIIKCAEVKYKCDTQKGSCVPDLTGTEASYNICTSNCSPQPLPPTPFTCATSPGSAEDKMFPHGNLKNDARWKSNFPKASELDSDIDKRAAGTAFGPNSYNWINTTPGSIDSIELAKIWILATHGFKKTWQNGEIVHGGYPTCSRALSTAGMESGAAEHPFNEYDAHFYGPNNGCRTIKSGGCWQTSNAYNGWSNCGKENLNNPFCSALQAWRHEAGNSGEGSCDSSNGIASYCTLEQLRTQQGGRTNNGHNQGCHFGALCYGWSAQGWNSPLSGALFRLCGEQEFIYPTPWPSSKNPPGSCNGWGKPGLEPNYNCEIAECACQKALKELKEDPEYSSISFVEDIDDAGYKSFIDACKSGPLSY